MAYHFAISALIALICYSAIQKQARRFREPFWEYFDNDASKFFTGGMIISLVYSVISLFGWIIQMKF